MSVVKEEDSGGGRRRNGSYDWVEHD